MCSATTMFTRYVRLQRVLMEKPSRRMFMKSTALIKASIAQTFSRAAMYETLDAAQVEV